MPFTFYLKLGYMMEHVLGEMGKDILAYDFTLTLDIFL